MDKTKKVAIIQQTFGLNTFENICFCQLKSVYNTYFKSNDTAKCIGIPSMQCLIYSLEGTGEIQYYGKSAVSLPAGKVFFGSMKKIFEIKSKTESWHFLCYWYFPENFEKELDGVYSSDEIDFEQEIQDANEIIGLLQTNSYFHISSACAKFTNKVIKLFNIFAHVSTPNKNTAFEKILEYINTHIKEKITTKTIAQEFGYCEKHIRYLFHKNSNTSPSKVIDSIKLAQIIELLQNTPLSLNDLAEMYNYSSASHLIANFKKKFDCTPKQYIFNLEERINKAKLKDDKI